ncbi:MAG: aminotransferase class I/II-fold pyridoxal phosphate-dependent enzyme [Lachnospiraceae bacterium]|nr:aminotransferase class I/II-fold pyridoxal phosphate-dependent enzyme [Lachnospiraceae bacterium]MBR1568433.1 aminotransferase class I/II-fold pyridoxal phosphate-dependent enzyme [Lachnospiraceae bacterium]
MLKQTDQFHGSDLEKVEEMYGIRREDIHPFASNVNPFGLSEQVKAALAEHMDVISDYPDREYKELKEAIHTYTGVDTEYILPGSGVTELIVTFIHTIKPKKTIVIEPTYSEYKRDLKEVKSEILDHVLQEKDDFQLNVDDLITKIDDSIDMVILCNPNNPTSTCISLERLKALTEHCKKTSTFLLVDETYIEFIRKPETLSALSLVKDYNNLLVLRGVSKFFAAPGLRLGYGCTSNTKLLHYINKHSNPWSINSIAAYAGPLLFKDTDYINKTRDQIALEQNLVCSALRLHKTLKVFPPATNFVLVKLLDKNMTADQVFEHCIKKGLMIRDCSNFMGLSNKYIRFCFLSPEEDDLLVNTLLEIL